ncbi:MAG: phosphoglycolate phosphatase [Denitrovibrio sp.]|nr:MAG: phosphoglycolate phosphatase [Denitrovibrio sp.]
MRLAIFDMDGTIIDTIGDIHSCLNKTMMVYNLPISTLENTKENVGNGMRQLVINTAGENNFIDQMETHFRAIYKQHMMDTTDIMPGFRDVLDYLEKSDITAVILSNKIRQISDDMMKSFGIEKYFHEWYGGDSFNVKKPSSVGVKSIIKNLGATPSKTIMIGDSYSDILAGQGAGAKTCFCSYGYGNLKNTNADYIVDSPAELINILEAF